MKYLKQPKWKELSFGNYGCIIWRRETHETNPFPFYGIEIDNGKTKLIGIDNMYYNKRNEDHIPNDDDLRLVLKYIFEDKIWI